MSDGPSLFGAERWAATELAEALCLSTQRINQLVKEGILPSPIDGRHAPREAVSRYVQHIRQRAESQSHAAEAVRKIQLENEMRKIRLQKIAGELVPAERVAKDWFEVTRRVRDGLLNLPSRLSGVFAAEASQEKIFESFTKEIHAVLHELATKPSAGKMPPDVPIEMPLESTRSPEDVPGDDESDHSPGSMNEGGHPDVQGPTEINGESR